MSEWGHNYPAAVSRFGTILDIEVTGSDLESQGYECGAAARKYAREHSVRIERFHKSVSDGRAYGFLSKTWCRYHVIERV